MIVSVDLINNNFDLFEFPLPDNYKSLFNHEKYLQLTVEFTIDIKVLRVGTLPNCLRESSL